MVNSCYEQFKRVEKEKFEHKMKEVATKREQERMNKLEELKNSNANLPLSSSVSKFRDRHFKLQQLKKHSIYNVKRFFAKSAPQKHRKRKYTRNQYYKLQVYMKKKKLQQYDLMNENDRYKTDERPEFNHFKRKQNLMAWQDFSYNPKTTYLLTRRIRSSMRAQSQQMAREKMRLDQLGKRLRDNLIDDIKVDQLRETVGVGGFRGRGMLVLPPRKVNSCRNSDKKKNVLSGFDRR